MSTSPLNGRLLTDTTLFQGGNDPVDTVLVRDVVQNNLCHFADEFAQVRVNWSAGVTTYTNGAGYLTARTASILSNFAYHIASFGPFPIALRQSSSTTGASYRLRVRLAGASSDGSAVTFYAVLGPPYAATALSYVAEDVTWAGTTSSGTMAFLTGASLGANAFTTQVVVPGSYLSRFLTETATKDDISGNRAGVQQCLVSLHVFCSSVTGTATGRLGAAYAAEWIGA